MLRPFVNIKIQQVTSYSFKDKNGVVNVIPRNREINLDFVTEYVIESSWEDHTNTCKITLPKNVVLEDGNALFKQAGTYSVILGGVTNQNYDGSENTYAPLIMRGDIVYVQDGYIFKNELGNDVEVGGTVFQGYVACVHSEIPIVIECEDNFYLLKHTPVNVSVWDNELVSLCKKILDWTNALFHDKNPLYPKLTFFQPDSITSNFSLGHLDIGTVTCGELLSRLKTSYHLYSTFKGNVLQFGYPIYDENQSKSNSVFEFQNNIFDDCDLQYTNKQDVILSTVVSCKGIKKTSRTTHDGIQATKKFTQKILVYWDVVTETFKWIAKKEGEPLPENTGGERHECIYAVDLTKPFPSNQVLADFGIKQLEKYFYTGFKGSFITIGFPYVDWNDNVNILDRVFSDRNGQYKVKKVIRTGGDGIEQEIFVDFKQSVPVPTISQTVYML